VKFGSHTLSVMLSTFSTCLTQSHTEAQLNVSLADTYQGCGLDIMLVLSISLGAFTQGITLAIPVVVSLFEFITADVSFVISS
jgi:hypothetical protein